MAQDFYFKVESLRIRAAKGLQRKPSRPRWLSAGSNDFSAETNYSSRDKCKKIGRKALTHSKKLQWYASFCTVHWKTLQQQVKKMSEEKLVCLSVQDLRVSGRLGKCQEEHWYIVLQPCVAMATSLCHSTALKNVCPLSHSLIHSLCLLVIIVLYLLSVWLWDLKLKVLIRLEVWLYFTLAETPGTFSISLVAALEGDICFQTVLEGYRLYFIWIQDPSNLLGILNLVRLNTYINHTCFHHTRNRAMHTAS